MLPSDWKRGLPGFAASLFVCLTTSFWVFWGTAEMFYEGWWGPWWARPVYLLPGAICFAMSAVALRWPRAGGWLLIAVGAVFTTWWWSLQFRRGTPTLAGLLSLVPVSALLVLTGILFLTESSYRRRRVREGWTPPAAWWRRNLRYLLWLGIPLIVFLVTAVVNAAVVLRRVDDGNRGARLIEGNGVRLVWAPAGPGWARGLDPQYGSFRALRPGEAPSWDEIARYGQPPPGYGKHSTLSHASAEDMRKTNLCRYLSADGLRLESVPQNIWRMPTTDEVVRSLVHHGQNAGCTWDGKSTCARCARQPGKESPLWASDWSPIYYWTADEFNEREAYYVSHAGWVLHQPKNWGNSRHGFRCVREP